MLILNLEITEPEKYLSVFISRKIRVLVVRFRWGLSELVIYECRKKGSNENKITRVLRKKDIEN